MNEARPYASLSSGLLARKGAAKPAMRPQGFTGFEDLGWNDMGYGREEAEEAALPEHVPSSISALTPAPKDGRADPADFGDENDAYAEGDSDGYAESESEAHAAGEGDAYAVNEAEAEQAPAVEAPSVVAQQRAILERFDGEEEPEVSPETPSAPKKPARAARAQVVPLPKRAAAAAANGRKAAFTLRLDTDRHLRLRLACAVTGRSAQQIVAVALDAALAEIPEIEALAARVPAGAKRN